MAGTFALCKIRLSSLLTLLRAAEGEELLWRRCLRYRAVVSPVDAIVASESLLLDFWEGCATAIDSPTSSSDLIITPVRKSSLSASGLAD